MITRKFKPLHWLLMIVFTCTALLAQADPGDGGDDPDRNAQIPFDGGISLVVAAGIAYAAKKGYDKRKKDNNNVKGM
jgi:hypothetical protein